MNALAMQVSFHLQGRRQMPSGKSKRRMQGGSRIRRMVLGGVCAGFAGLPRQKLMR